MQFERITEQTSDYRHPESMSIHNLLVNINHEDTKVPAAIAKVIPHIEKLVAELYGPDVAIFSMPITQANHQFDKLIRDNTLKT